MEAYVGLDVHSKESVFVVLDGMGAVIHEDRIPTTHAGFDLLRTRYGLEPGTAIALESGTTAFFAARHLARLELEPVVVDAQEVRAKASRPKQKSDRRDAFELADGLRRGIYGKLVHVPDANVQRLRLLLSRRRHFVRLMTREVSAAKYLLRAEGLPELAKSLRTKAAWDQLHASTAALPELQAVIGCHRAVWLVAHEQVAALERMLFQVGRLFADAMRRLQAIPGVGPIVALTLIAVLSDVDRFPTSGHAASYAGIVPSTHQSGRRDRHGHITKTGSGELRAMLCEAAHQACRQGSPLNPHFAKVCGKRGYKMAIVALAHRLLRIAWSMLRNGTDFDISRLGVEAGVFVVKTTRRYRLRKPAAGSAA